MKISDYNDMFTIIKKTKLKLYGYVNQIVRPLQKPYYKEKYKEEVEEAAKGRDGWTMSLN